MSKSLGNVVTGTLAGMAGGAFASWVMNKYIAVQQQQQQQQGQGQLAQRQPAQRAQRSSGRAAHSNGGRPQVQAKAKTKAGDSGGGEDATVKTAEAISRNVFEHELTDSQKKIAGPAVHYAYGTLVGGLYGGLAELVPVVGGGFGMPYGIALWLLGDEVAVPALELGPPPTQVPAEKHADYLAAHLVYGITLDVTRRFMRHVL